MVSLDVDLQPVYDQSSVVGIAVVYLEVTERRQVRALGAGGDKRLYVLTEFAPDVITVAARDGHVRLVSGGVQESLGYSPLERLSQSLFNDIHPEDVTAFQSQFAGLVAGSIDGFSRQLRIRHKNGTYRWFDLDCVSEFDNPFIRGVVVSARDLTDWKMSQARLRDGDDVFRLAAEAVNGTIFEWDLVRGGVRRSRGVDDVPGAEPDDSESREAWSARNPSAGPAGLRVEDDGRHHQRPRLDGKLPDSQSPGKLPFHTRARPRRAWPRR